MSTIQDWSNENAGYVELGGHLVGALQRSRQIQAQQQQIEALKGLQFELQRQRLKQEMVEASQNVLYDYKAACGEISERVRQNSAEAYARLMLLDTAVQESGIGHDMFGNLEWKEFCTKTLRDIAELKAWALQNLDSEARNKGDEIVTRLQAEANRVADERTAALKQAEHLRLRDEAIKNGTRLGRISFWLGFACLLGGFLTAVPAVILGHKSLRALKGFENVSRSYAITGLIIGYAFLACLALAIVYTVLSGGFSLPAR